MIRHETDLYDSGYKIIAGTDEVGRGPLAGPVVACAVVLPYGLIIDGVDDSKKLSAKKREKLSMQILNAASDCTIGVIDAETIDRINILQASLKAMANAIFALSPAPDAVIVDGKFAPPVKNGVFVKCLIHGDLLCHSVAAASIVAKVRRDALMNKLHEQYPQYGFDKHKGYGTPAHYKALREYGPCPIHRRSFKL